MSKWMEELLNEKKVEYHKINISTGAEDAVRKGIQRAIQERKLRNNFYISIAASVLVIATFFCSIKVSPAFASYISRVPVLEGVLQLISQDKGIQQAIDNDLMQPINISDAHDGVTLSVNGVITDEARMIVFYKLEGSKRTIDSLSKLIILDENGEKLQAGFAIRHFQENESDEGISDFVDIAFAEGIPLPKRITMMFKTHTNNDSGKWQVTFGINPTRNTKKIFPINKNIVVGNQMILLDKITIYPTRLVLAVIYNDSNSQYVFQPMGLRFIDQLGHEWKMHSSVRKDEKHQLFYFESIYFSNPKKLKLLGDGISALHKEQVTVVIDPKSKVLLNAPEGLKLLECNVIGDDLRIHFSVNLPARGINLSFDQVSDAKGKIYSLGNGEWISSHDRNESWETILSAAHAIGPITLNITSYPAAVEERFEIDISLK